MDERIDVRGPVPVYINGMITLELVGYTRSVTLEEARAEYYRQSLDKKLTNVIDVSVTDLDWGVK